MRRLLNIGLVAIGVMLFVVSCNRNKENVIPEKEICESNCEGGKRLVTHNFKVREYVINVSPNYKSSEPASLILNFHGFGGDMTAYAESYGSSLADVIANENVVVVYPQGIERTKGDAEWDPYDNGSENIMQNDPFFVEQLIADVKREFSIDTSRIYAVGYSNGGMMAYGLACNRANLIAAAGIMSGVMLPDEGCNTSETTSIIHFHGTDDFVIPVEGGWGFQAVSDNVDYWLSHNNIPVATKVSTELNEGDVVRDEYLGGDDNTSYVLYTVKEEYGYGGNHVWFTEDIEGESPNRILWDFLSKHTVND